VARYPGKSYLTNTCSHRPSGPRVDDQEKEHTEPALQHRSRADKYITLPHKNDLDLGIILVREFVWQCIPDQAER